jgi:hypothetical protein
MDGVTWYQITVYNHDVPVITCTVRFSHVLKFHEKFKVSFSALHLLNPFALLYTSFPPMSLLLHSSSFVSLPNLLPYALPFLISFQLLRWRVAIVPSRRLVTTQFESENPMFVRSRIEELNEYFRTIVRYEEIYQNAEILAFFIGMSTECTLAQVGRR